MTKYDEVAKGNPILQDSNIIDLNGIDDPILKQRISSIMSKSTNTNENTFSQNISFIGPSQTNRTLKTKEHSILMSIIERIISIPCRKLASSPFRFERTHEAAHHNSRMILENGGDLESLVSSLSYSFTHYGSEFRDIVLLEELLSSNNKWSELKSIINKGVDYEMDEINEDDRKMDIDFHLNRGNHKSASTDMGLKTINKAFDKEVSLGWQIPILPNSIKDIKGACITPLGIATQWTINARNERILKERVTHDCTFPGPSGLSANIRVPDELLDPCIYGFALKRLSHEVHQMRYRHKAARIISTKTDMDAAYRRVHTSIKCALAVITVVPSPVSLAHILLRLPFGARRAGGKFSVISDTITDLATEISSDDSWDPDLIHSDIYRVIEDLPVNLENSENSFGQAYPLFVDMEPKDIAFDNYIDDIIGIGIDLHRIRKCLLHAPALACHVLFRPVIKSDPIKRNNIINSEKHQAEGLLEEVKVILGWRFNFRSFKVFLPSSKLKDWSVDLDEAIENKKIKTKTFESIVGRLNHAGYVVPFGKYFLNRLRKRLTRVRQRNYRTTIFELKEIEDLILWKKLLFHACINGIDLNHVNFTEPSITCYSDACEYGLGGYIVKGPAWRFKIPDELLGYFSINFLEFLAAVLTIELAIEWRNDKDYPHRILSFTDNSSTLSWLFRANFDPSSHEAHETVARSLAWLCTSNNTSLFSQHISGIRNSIADTLSRDFHLSNSDLTEIILSHLPKQVHSQFKIVSHPRDISSWMHSLKPGNRTKAVSIKPRTKDSLQILRNGETTLRTLDSEMYGYDPSVQQTRTSWLQGSQEKLDRTRMAKSSAKRSSWPTPWQPPSVLFQRPFEKMHFKTQH